MKILLNYILLVIALISCTPAEDDGKNVAAFEVYAEMVANGAKPVALHHPLLNEDIEAQWADYLRIAKDYVVEIYREEDFPNILLFSPELTANKTVLILYQGDRLEQYQQLKHDLEKADSARNEQIHLARRFGRLLGYDNHGINRLLRETIRYETFTSFDVQQQVTHFYYENIREAIDFYKNTLGLQPIDSSTFRISENASLALHSFNEEYTAEDPKSVAIALLTHQLPQWYAYIQEQGIPIKYTYKPHAGGPHDGFVAIDPGGYLLEFEQFKQHPENELFMAVLKNSFPVQTSVDSLNFYGSITWTYHNDLLKMQQFYEEKLGYTLVADQGWTKIYQTTGDAFIGLVDGCRGMEDYAEKKAVELEWQVNELESFRNYASVFWTEYDSERSYITGPDGYRYKVK